MEQLDVVMGVRQSFALTTYDTVHVWEDRDYLSPPSFATSLAPFMRNKLSLLFVS